MTVEVDNILIGGMGKSGTTGTYNAVKGALEVASVTFDPLFEPVSERPVTSLTRHRPHRTILAKVMIEHVEKVLVTGLFPNRVMLVRDPRDILVSRLLFRPLTRASIEEVPEEEHERFFAAIEEKEQDPGRRSVRDLHTLADRAGMSGSTSDQLDDAFDQLVRLIDDGGFEVLRYEDFVDGRLDGLSDHLGLEVTNPRARGSEWLQHISRSGSYGEWRSWFTEEDRAHFIARLGPLLERFGYDPDEELASEPSLDPETGSAYLRENRKRRVDAVSARYGGRWEPTQVTDRVGLSHLVDMASDGDALAAYRAGVLYAEGRVVDRDIDAAARWYTEAAVRGHRRAARELAVLPAGRSDLWARQSQRFWALEVERDDEERRLRRDLDAATSEIDRLRSSFSYRLGAAVVALVRSPWARGRPQLAALAQVVRRRFDRRRTA